MNAQLQPIFPEPIVEYSKIGADQARISRLYEQQQWEPTNTGDNPEYFLKISRNLNVLGEDQQLKDFFEGLVNNYASKFLLYENRFHATTSWFTMAEKDKISILHNHGNAMFCAVYYFGLSGDRKAQIAFEKPVLSQFDLKPKQYNVLNGPAHVFDMGNDSMLVFPSYLKHKVVRHEHDEVRKSLAMNFMPIGRAGAGTTEIQFPQQSC